MVMHGCAGGVQSDTHKPECYSSYTFVVWRQTAIVRLDHRLPLAFARCRVGDSGTRLSQCTPLN